MDNLQITTLCEHSLVLVKYDKKRKEWYAERARDGLQSPRYRDIRVLAEDLKEAGADKDFWEKGKAPARFTTEQPKPVDVLQWAAE